MSLPGWLTETLLSWSCLSVSLCRSCVTNCWWQNKLLLGGHSRDWLCLFFLLPRPCLSNLHFSPVLRGNIFICTAGAEALFVVTLLSLNLWKRKSLMAAVCLLLDETWCLIQGLYGWVQVNKACCYLVSNGPWKCLQCKQYFSASSTANPGRLGPKVSPMTASSTHPEASSLIQANSKKQSLLQRALEVVSATALKHSFASTLMWSQNGSGAHLLGCHMLGTCLIF